MRVCNESDKRKCSKCRHCLRATYKSGRAHETGRSHNTDRSRYPRFVLFGNAPVEVLYGKVILVTDTEAVVGMGQKHSRKVRMPIGSFRRVSVSGSKPVFESPHIRVPRLGELVGCGISHPDHPWCSHQELLLALT